MTAITGATTDASLVERVNSEYIQRLAQPADMPVPLWRIIADIVFGDGWSAPVYTVTQWSRALVPLSFGSGKTETDEFAATEQLAVEVQATGGVIGIRKAPSFELQDDYITGGLIADLSMLNEEEMDDQMTEDVLALVTSATTTSNFSGTDFTVERFGEAKASLRANNPRGGRTGFFGNTVPISDFESSVRGLGGQVYSDPSVGAGAILKGGMATGYVGTFEQIDFFNVHDNAPQYDSTNWASLLMAYGPGGALKMPIWTQVNTLFDVAITRLSSEIVTWGRYAVAIQNQNKLVEIVTSKT